MLSEVRGQGEGVRFLKRVVDRYLSSPLLLVGDEGVGRRFSVLQAAKEMFCKAGEGPSCQCFDCLAIDRLLHPDLVHLATRDGKDIGVEEVREMIEQASSYPTSAPVRFFIVDGADRLTVPAANAMLKTLEEPPNRSRFFLLAETHDRVLSTIRSRCGRVAYRRLPEEFVVSVIEKIEDDPTKALVYARMAEGSVGRAVKYWGSNQIKVRDQVLSLVSFGLSSDLSSLFAAVDELDDLKLGLKLLDQVIHDLLMLGHDSSRLINLDVKDQLEAMRRRGEDATWVRLRGEMKLVYDRLSSVSINLPFHVKAAFVQTFFTVG